MSASLSPFNLWLLNDTDVVFLPIIWIICIDTYFEGIYGEQLINSEFTRVIDNSVAAVDTVCEIHCMCSDVKRPHQYRFECTDRRRAARAPRRRGNLSNLQSPSGCFHQSISCLSCNGNSLFRSKCPIGSSLETQLQTQS